MAVTATVAENFNFVGGLNTEGGYFVTPKNSFVEGDNCIPQKDGGLLTRNALELESNFSTSNYFGTTLHSSNTYNQAYAKFRWDFVNNKEDVSFFVVQSGNILHFYDANTSITSINKRPFTVSLNTYKISQVVTFDSLAYVQVAPFYGNLLVTHKHINPIVLQFKPDTNTLEVYQLKLRIRDFKGIFTGYPDSVEKTDAEWTALGFKEAVVYNLLNQGWNGQQIGTYRTSTGKYPSNAKSWVFGKDSNDDFTVATLNKQDFGNSPSPKGRNIIEAFDQARSYPNDYFGDLNYIAPPVPSSLTSKFNEELGFYEFVTIPGYTPDPTSVVTAGAFLRESYASRPSACAFFAGRAFYAGATSNVVNSWVLYSQVTENYTKLGDCFQKNDPTAEVIADLLDDDGGLIVIQNCGQIVSLKPVGNALLVFATNGVWSIYGGDSGFKATSYIVDKVSDVGCISALSIVAVENSILYWSEQGIYSVTVDSSGLAQAQNISNKNIQTYYANIPYEGKEQSTGTYDKNNKIVYWLYGENTEQLAIKTKMLCLNVEMGAYYAYKFPTTSGYRSCVILDCEFSNPLLSNGQLFNIVAGSDNVIAGSNNVVATIDITDNTNGLLKFLVSYVNNSNYTTFTFADFQETRVLPSTSYVDFSVFTPHTNASTLEPTPVTQPARYILTSYALGNNGPAKAKSIVYLVAFLKRTETATDANGLPLNQGSCLLQTRWDYTDNTIAGKWTDEQQLYRNNRVFLLNPNAPIVNGYPLIVSKNKVRGRGKALQMKFEAEANKQMHLYGWTIDLVGNTNV